MQATATGGTRTRSAALNLDDLTETDTDSRLWYLDIDSGRLYERDTEEATDDDAVESWTDVGKVTPPGDGVAPSKVVDVVVSPVSITQPDGTSVPGFTVSWSAVPETDVVQYEVQYDLTTATWVTPVVRMAGIGTLAVTVEGITGNVDYDFRVRALDVDSLPGPWSDVVTATAPKDNDAPDMPTEVIAASGFRMVGLSWSRSQATDLAMYQVRYYLDSTPEDFVIVNMRSNRAIIDGLIPEQAYGFQVRAIDRSNNVVTSDVDNTAVDYTTNPEAGWTSEVVQTPSYIVPADIAVNSLIATLISADMLSADNITAGTLALGGLGNPISLSIFDASGNPMGLLGNDGLYLWDPVSDNKAIWLYGDFVKFTDDFDPDDIPSVLWSTAIDSRGVNASAILFGSDVGGHNRVPNAGMESAPFPTTAPTSKVWNASAGSPSWDDAASAVNLKTDAATLQMTAV